MSQERPETPTRSQGNTPSVSPFDSPSVSARNSADEEVDYSRLSRCSIFSKLHAEPSIFLGRRTKTDKLLLATFLASQYCQALLLASALLAACVNAVTLIYVASCQLMMQAFPEGWDAPQALNSTFHMHAGALSCCAQGALSTGGETRSPPCAQTMMWGSWMTSSSGRCSLCMAWAWAWCAPLSLLYPKPLVLMHETALSTGPHQPASVLLCSGVLDHGFTLWQAVGLPHSGRSDVPTAG